MSWRDRAACIGLDTEEIPDRCPTHGAELIWGITGPRERLNHAGVSGYGVQANPDVGAVS